MYIEKQRIKNGKIFPKKNKEIRERTFRIHIRTSYKTAATKIGTDEVIEFEVSGDHIQAVHMLPGYTHNIINLSDTEDLVTVMYCNEIFDPNKPDTFFDPVK